MPPLLVGFDRVRVWLPSTTLLSPQLALFGLLACHILLMRRRGSDLTLRGHGGWDRAFMDDRVNN
jgi:hypothetical protein